MEELGLEPYVFKNFQLIAKDELTFIVTMEVFKVRIVEYDATTSIICNMLSPVREIKQTIANRCSVYGAHCFLRSEATGMPCFHSLINGGDILSENLSLLEQGVPARSLLQFDKTQ